MSRDLTLYTRLRQRVWNEKIVPAEQAYKKAFRDLVRVFTLVGKDFTQDQTILLFLKHFSEMYQYANLVQAYAQSFAVFFVRALVSHLDAIELENLFTKEVLENPKIHDDPATEFDYRLSEYLRSHPKIQDRLSQALFALDRSGRPNFRSLRQLQLLRAVLGSVSTDHEAVTDGNAHHFTRASIVAYALDDFLRTAYDFFKRSESAAHQKLARAAEAQMSVDFSQSDEKEYVVLHQEALRIALRATEANGLSLGRFVEGTLSKMDPETGREIVCDEPEHPPSDVVVDVSKRRTAVIKQWQVVSKSRDANRESYAALFARGAICIAGSRARYTLDLFQMKAQRQQAELQYARPLRLAEDIHRRRSSGVNVRDLPDLSRALSFSTQQNTAFFTRKRVLLGLGVLALTAAAVVVPYVVVSLAVLWVAVAAASTFTLSSTLAFFLARKSSANAAQIHPTPVRRVSQLSQSTASTTVTETVAVTPPRKAVTPATTPSQKSLESPTRPRAGSADSDLSLERSPIKTPRRLDAQSSFTSSHALMRAALPRPLQLSDASLTDESVSVFSPRSQLRGTPVTTPGKYFDNPMHTPKESSTRSPLHPRVLALREESTSPRGGTDSLFVSRTPLAPRRVSFV